MISRLGLNINGVCFFPLARNLYWVSSLGRHYYTDLENETCNCRGWMCHKVKKDCKHLSALRKRFER